MAARWWRRLRSVNNNIVVYIELTVALKKSLQSFADPLGQQKITGWPFVQQIPVISLFDVELFVLTAVKGKYSGQIRYII